MSSSSNKIPSNTPAPSSLKEAFPEIIRRKLRPVRTFWDEENLPVTTNLVDLEYQVDTEKPFDVLPITDVRLEDQTVLEVVDSKMLCVKQIGEDGEPHAVILTPAQLLLLCHKAGNIIYLPGGCPLVTEQ